MTKVTLRGTTVADSNDTILVEGNRYFPPSAVNTAVFSDSDTEYTCPWKGPAQYHNATIDGEIIKDVGWSYPNALEKAKYIEGYFAFDKNQVVFV